MDPMKSKMFVQHVTDTTIITFNDARIVEPEYIKDLEECIMVVLDQARRLDLVLDFCNVEFMSSALLGLLVKIHKKVCERKGRLQLCNISPNLYKVFEITRLDRVFDISRRTNKD